MSDKNDIDIIDEHERAFLERFGEGYTLQIPNNATIDKEGHRHVFMVENSRGIRKYFDQSEYALALARTSKFTPCKLYQIPILPRWSYHTTPIDRLSLMIETKLRDESK